MWCRRWGGKSTRSPRRSWICGEKRKREFFDTFCQTSITHSFPRSPSLFLRPSCSLIRDESDRSAGEIACRSWREMKGTRHGQWTCGHREVRIIVGCPHRSRLTIHASSFIHYAHNRSRYTIACTLHKHPTKFFFSSNFLRAWEQRLLASLCSHGIFSLRFARHFDLCSGHDSSSARSNGGRHWNCVHTEYGPASKSCRRITGCVCKSTEISHSKANPRGLWTVPAVLFDKR